MNIERFKKLPIMGILRGISPEVIGSLVEASYAGGLYALEVAMNTPGAEGIIRKAAEVSGGRMAIGAGTVLNMEMLEDALSGGATFIVMPTLVEEVMNYCMENDIPFFPGAFTPLEIYKAWRAGATMVKFFPASFFGPEYIKEIKGPFQDIDIMACGGVNLQNIKKYFACGARAVAVGGGVFRKEWIEKKDFTSITSYVSLLTGEVRAADAR